MENGERERCCYYEERSLSSTFQGSFLFQNLRRWWSWSSPRLPSSSSPSSSWSSDDPLHFSSWCFCCCSLLLIIRVPLLSFFTHKEKLVEEMRMMKSTGKVHGDDDKEQPPSEWASPSEPASCLSLPMISPAPERCSRRILLLLILLFWCCRTIINLKNSRRNV